MATVSCPSPKELSAFAVGNVSGTAFARIAGHVEECGQCEALLQAFDESADGLVTGLRHLPARAGKEIGELPPDLMMIARRAPVAPANGVPAEISIDSGRRYARQLAQGDCRLGKFR